MEFKIIFMCDVLLIIIMMDYQNDEEWNDPETEKCAYPIKTYSGVLAFELIEFANDLQAASTP